MTDASEREDLEGLLKHPGWLRIVEIAQQEWHTNLDAKLRMAADKTDEALALSQIRQVLVAKEAVQRFIAYPKERASLLARQTAADFANAGALNRGGY